MQISDTLYIVSALRMIQRDRVGVGTNKANKK